MGQRGTFTQQLKALVWRNILLKIRNKKQTVQEFLLPVGFILLLALIKWLSTPKQEVAIRNFPANGLFTPQFTRTGLLYVYDNSTEVRDIVDLVCQDGDFEPVYFSSISSMDQSYEDLQNKSDVSAGLVFELNTTNLQFNYTIRVPNSQIPDEKPFEFVNRGSCRDPSGLSKADDCQANKYLWTGFAALQASVDGAIIRVYGNQPKFVRPQISVKLFPKDVYTPDTTFIRYLSSIYVILAFMPFVGILMAMIVTEKEKKIKETMRMMGMMDSAFWSAWGIVYIIMALIISIIITLLGWAAQLLVRSNLFILFLLIFLYCTSVIAMGFMMSTFFSSAKVASAAGSLAPMLVSMLYFAVAATRTYRGGLPTSAIPPGGQWALCLFSPLSLALGIDWALFLDITFEDGANFGSNMYLGEFPLYAPILMLAFDTVLYAVLAVWLDSVVPTEYGSSKFLFYCLMPSFWKQKKKTDEEMEQLVTDSLRNHDDGDGVTRNCDIENIPSSMAKKAVLRIHNIKKKFKVDEEEGTVERYAVNGISLDIYEGQITALLGHNGAGKTTLINMLTGLMPPTSGSATTYGLNVSDTNDMTHIRQFTGVCPQQNVLFQDLSAVENLYVFGMLAGIPEQSISKQIERSLTEVDLIEQKHKRACNLSGGQKRKLSLAIALIGNPKVIFLDEPTAGMDPASRRHVWAVLKKRRAGRVIVLTTHFMDEADILADRKAVICNGQVRCVGSSLFLKNKFGIGYYLNMVASSNCDMQGVDDLVHRYVPTAEQGRSHGMELTYTLPYDDVDKFAGLFSELEGSIGGETKAQSLGISSYGVSMTTLEEVFLKLENSSGNLEDARPILKNGWRKKPLTDMSATRENNHTNSANDLNNHTSVEMMRPSSTDSSRTFPITQDKVQLAKQRFFALVKIKFLIQLRNPAAVFFRLGFPVILMLLGVCFYQFVFIENSSHGWETPKKHFIDPYAYTHVPARQVVPRILFKSVEDFGSEPPYYIEDYPSFEFGLYTQGFNRTQDFNSTLDLLELSPLHMGFIIHKYHVNKAYTPNELKDTNFTVLYNDTAIHSLPAALNILSNSILRASVPWINVTNTSTFTSLHNRINVTSYPWPDVGMQYGFSYGSFFIVMLAGMALSIIPPGFGADLVTDREIKARSQLRTAGMTHDMYMGATVFADSCQIYGVMFVFIIIILAFQVEGFYHPGAMLCLVLLFLFYGFLNMLTVYNLSFFFKKTESALNVLPMLTFLVALIPYMAVGLLDSYEGTAKTVAFSLHILLSLANPLYASYGGLNYILKVYRTHVGLYGPTEYLPISAYFEWQAGIVIVLIAPPVHCIWNYFLLRYLEVRSTGGDIRDAFQVCGCRPKEDDISCQNDDVPDNEDVDVTEERERVQLFDRSAEEPVVKVLGLRKEFKTSKEDTKKQQYQTLQTENGMMVAVKNVSFAVMPGEVFGLLGPNGAGKTTSLNMIIAETNPSKGHVTAGGHNVHSSMSEAFKVMGYCPQHDALWDRITPKEHIECYAAIRGIPYKEVPLVADYFMDNLAIQEHRNKRSKTLSGGTKRKLSYAMSMLGDPKIVLLDEPSTGMDPVSKRFLWDTITSSFEGSRRGAILTTHYMEEADALCSRISIMVNGRMECIGSTQHLKDKYGGGYILEVKVGGASEQQEALQHNMARLHEFIHQLFPGAERVEYFSDWMTYKIPQKQVKSLAAIFEAFEDGKRQFNIEEYSFCQSTLEQVFLQFAKLQSEDLEEEENAALKRQSNLSGGSSMNVTQL